MTDVDHGKLLEAALAFHAAGCCVVPARPDGSKAPIGQWADYQRRMSTREEILTWFAGDAYDGFGLVCGAVSGNLELLELEGRALTEDMHTQLTEIADASGLGDLWRRVNEGYQEYSPNAGLHLLYRVDGIVAGNTKLAQRPGRITNVEVLAETRGEGGYVVVAPSAGRTHPTRKAWILLNGAPEKIPTITAAERDALHILARTLDAMPERENSWTASSASTGSSGGTSNTTGVSAPYSTADATAPGPGSGDDYNAKTTWHDLLVPLRWRPIYTAGRVTYWRRPGKDTGISATTGRNDGDNLYVFSTSTLFEQERPYSKFAAYSLLEHGGSFREAGKALYAAGYGQRVTHDDLAQLIAGAGAIPLQPASSETPLAEDQPTRDRTSWWPRDLEAVMSGHDTDPKPTVLTREDGQPLFYAGKVNGLLGESESGKTWIVLLAVLQQLQVGENVLYLDFEDTAAGIVGRLRELGATDPELGRLTYIGPDESLHLAASADLTEALELYHPGLVVIDGVNAAMTLLGLDLVDNTDATKFVLVLMRPITRTGAVVVAVDHVPKNAEQRGKGGIGAQAKRAMVTGCSLAVEVTKPFGRGMTGRLKLTVDKDRPGHVRAISGGANYAGTAILESHPDTGAVTVRIEAPDLRPAGEKPKFRYTGYMEKVSHFLLTIPEGASGAAIEKHLGGKRDYVREAYNTLVDEGYVSRHPGGPNGAIIHKHERLYTELDELDPTSPSSPQPRPTSPRGEPQKPVDFAPQAGYAPESVPVGARSTAAPGVNQETNQLAQGEIRACSQCGIVADAWDANLLRGVCQTCRVDR